MTASRIRLARGAGIVGAIGLVAIAVTAPRAAGAGWLIGFVSVAAVVFGSIAWRLIHALTGGRWGMVLRPALSSAAAGAPVLLVCFLLLLLAGSSAYPWVHDPGSVGPGVGSLYLNSSLFAARGIVFIVGLAVIAMMSERAGFGRLAAGLGLVWYGVGMDLVSVDWLLSLDPRYTSSAFGAQIVVAQLVAALAAAILLLDDADADDRADLAALLLATVLGESYLVLMTFIVDWYGDQPVQAGWYLQRSTHGWLWLEVAGVVVGSLAPIVVLLFARARRSAVTLKIAAAAALLGVVLENIWLVAPVFGPSAVLAGLFALAAVTGLTVGIELLLPRQRARHGI